MLLPMIAVAVRAAAVQVPLRVRALAREVAQTALQVPVRVQATVALCARAAKTTHAHAARSVDAIDSVIMQTVSRYAVAMERPAAVAATPATVARPARVIKMKIASAGRPVNAICASKKIIHLHMNAWIVTLLAPTAHLQTPATATACANAAATKAVKKVKHACKASATGATRLHMIAKAAAAATPAAALTSHARATRTIRARAIKNAVVIIIATISAMVNV
ncbi:MAG: hypothetical protein EB060_10365 [Proteobacteria bacterium]|nr:hypothetical protein [Pseudomonadota bacterium]